MIQSRGGGVIGNTCNYNVWGHIVVTFKKGVGMNVNLSLESKISKSKVLVAFKQFQDELRLFKSKLDLLDSKLIYGFGAAQNYPVLDCFLNHSMPYNVKLDYYFQRENKYYPNLPFSIEKPRDSYKGYVGVLTGIDYARVLIDRMANLDLRTSLCLSAPFNQQIINLK